MELYGTLRNFRLKHPRFVGGQQWTHPLTGVCPLLGSRFGGCVCLPGRWWRPGACRGGVFGARGMLEPSAGASAARLATWGCGNGAVGLKIPFAFRFAVQKPDVCPHLCAFYAMGVLFYALFHIAHFIQ